ncbi:hypothetical protein GCM10010885_02460 [Alicyclobacillus cellulosilyticus]|uniref:Uncharacterized protein n=1 Tax=Alicyclobacillus cellulosilyticus TaxID=1003997 RepID=A0A917NFP0_9BACL|nr:hypothetical protein GCM10010885_02460 [Alicyclobacillus cellulosilyticus]
MGEYTTQQGIWNGWYWRFLALLVLAVAVLQSLAAAFLHYPITTSLPLALLVVAYMTAPRVKERRLANTLAGVVAMFLVNLLLEWVFDRALLLKEGWLVVAEANGFALAVGLAMAYLYLRLTIWSERKREELESRRRQQDAEAPPPVRRHRKKKKRRR